MMTIILLKGILYAVLMVLISTQKLWKEYLHS